VKPVTALVHGMSADANLLIAGAHVLDPRSDLDVQADVLVRAGQIVEIAAAGELSAAGDTEVAQGDGKHLLPAFVDPHVWKLARAPPPSVASAR
jgi:dihydroorotase